MYGLQWKVRAAAGQQERGVGGSGGRDAGCGAQARRGPDAVPVHGCAVIGGGGPLLFSIGCGLNGEAQGLKPRALGREEGDERCGGAR